MKKESILTFLKYFACFFTLDIFFRDAMDLFSKGLHRPADLGSYVLGAILSLIITSMMAARKKRNA